MQTNLKENYDVSVCKMFESKYSTSSEIIYLLELEEGLINSDILYQHTSLTNNSRVPTRWLVLEREPGQDSTSRLETFRHTHKQNSLYIK